MNCTMKWYIVLILLLPSIVFASGRRIADWDGGSIVVNGVAGKAVEINFPQQVLEVIKGAEGADVQIKDKSVFIKIVSDDISDLQLFVSTSQGPIYALDVKLAKGEPDFVIEVRDSSKATAERSVEIQRAAKDVDPVSLIVAMARRESVSGFAVDDRKQLLKRFSRNGILEATLSKVYQSPYYTGYVVDLKNLSVLPLQLKESDFVAPSVIAVAFSDENGYMSPTPKNAEEAQAGGHKMKVYLVALPSGGH